MSKEREVGWSEKRIEALKEKLTHLGIDAFVFDLDDTLKRTYFVEGRRVYMQALAQQSGVEINEQEFMAEWYATWKSLHPLYGVHPRAHVEVSGMMASKYGLAWEDEALQIAFQEMWQMIYHTVPEPMPGAEEAIGLLKALDSECYVVTHGQPDWTDLKLSDWEGWFDGVHCVDVYGAKDHVAWANALEVFGLNPHRIVVVGDNIQADLISTSQLGVRYLFHMGSQHSRVTGVLPDGAQQISDLTEVFRLLEEAGS